MQNHKLTILIICLLLLFSLVIAYPLSARTTQEYNTAQSAYFNFIETGDPKLLREAHSILSRIQIESHQGRYIPRTPFQQFICEIVALEMIVRDLTVSSGYGVTYKRLFSQISNVWFSLLNMELNDFAGYELAQNPTVAAKQYNVFIWYNRFLELLINTGYYIDQSNVLTPLARNAVKRILSYPSYSYATTENKITQEDSIHWSNFENYIDIEYPNFGLTVSLWKGEITDRDLLRKIKSPNPTKSESDSLKQYIVIRRAAQSYFLSALKHARSNLSKYITLCGLAREVMAEGELERDRSHKWQLIKSAYLYYYEAVSLELNREDLHLIQGTTFSDTVVLASYANSNQNFIVSTYNPKTIQMRYINCAIKYSDALVDEDDMAESIKVLERIIDLEFDTLNDRKRIAAKLRDRTGLVLSYAEYFEPSEFDLSRIQKLHLKAESILMMKNTDES